MTIEKNKNGRILSPVIEAPPSRTVRAVFVVAVAMALLLAVLFGVRKLDSEDLGYHLAYGEHLLDTGRIVDSSPFIYTVHDAPGPPPGPGQWYDASGKFRFANANWLTQLVLAAVYRAAGMAGLSILAAATVAAIFVLVLLCMRRLGVPPPWQAAGLLLTALVAYERLLLRPELFTFLLLTTQLYLLLAAYTHERFRWWRAAALFSLQLLLVNVHSYFLLGLALTGAVLADYFLRTIWTRGDPERRAESRQKAVVLGAALAAQIAACFINPWTWRLTALPIETVIFVQREHITTPVPGQVNHPLSTIGEFYPPLAPGLWQNITATYAYIVLLAMAAVALVAALMRRRWGWALIIAGMTAVSLTMRRNIAPAAMLIVPPAIASLLELFHGAVKILPARLRSPAALALAVLVTLAAAGLSVSVAANDFYARDRRITRFGLGVSPLKVPLAAAQFVNEHVRGRAWCDFNSSSNLHFFTRPHRDVPVLTNTWSYPPAVLLESLDYGFARRPFDRAVADYGVSAVVLRVDSASEPLARELMSGADWALVHVDAYHAVFVRRDGPDGRLAQRAIDPRTFDVAAYKLHLAGEEADPAFTLWLAGATLSRLASAFPPPRQRVEPSAQEIPIAWENLAVDCLRAALERNATDDESWTALGLCLARRGCRRIASSEVELGAADWREARRCFQQALNLHPDNEAAKTNLPIVDDQLRWLKRGIIKTGTW